MIMNSLVFPDHPDNKKTSDQRRAIIGVESRGPYPCLYLVVPPSDRFRQNPDEAMELIIDGDDHNIAAQNHEARVAAVSAERARI
jgi:hypothetical protein